MRISKLAIATLTATLATTPALAQKSQDTLRIAIVSPFAILSTYDLPHEESGMIHRDVYDYLLRYDEHNKKFVPGLAKSWKRISDMTLEFELRDDIKFHNGNKFDAADVKSTVDYIIDPKSKITYASRYNWVKEIEVLGPHKIRVHAREPVATDLNTLAYRFQIWDGEVLDKLSDKADYGRVSPVGSGLFKVTNYDRQGITVERYEGYNTIAGAKAPIKRIRGIFMPDRDTQAAELLTGGIDWIRDTTPDTAKALAEKPNLKVTYLDTPRFIYLALDSQNKSGNKALSDPRVRKAMHMAIDRENIIKYIVPGGDVAEHVQGLCFEKTIGCDYDVKPPKHDPAAAKKLMAEAGYPNGFELDYLVFQPARAIAEAVAGDLLKIGVKAKISVANLGLYRNKQGAGELQAWSILFPTGSYPDVGNIFGVFFSETAFHYYNDPIITEAMQKGEAEFDPVKRTAIYKKALNRINEMHYILPISSVPVLHVHTKDAKLKTNIMSAGETYISDFEWN